MEFNSVLESQANSIKQPKSKNSFNTFFDNFAITMKYSHAFDVLFQFSVTCSWCDRSLTSLFSFSRSFFSSLNRIYLKTS